MKYNNKFKKSRDKSNHYVKKKIFQINKRKLEKQVKSRLKVYNKEYLKRNSN